MTRSSRESEKRIHEMLPSYSMEYRSPLDVPEEIKKPGYSYYWARREVKGESDYEVERLTMQGWSLVPLDRMTKSRYNMDPLNRNPIAQQFICYKDVILMERPEEFSIKEAEHLRTFNKNRIRSLKGVHNDTGTTSIKAINSF